MAISEKYILGKISEFMNTDSGKAYIRENAGFNFLGAPGSNVGGITQTQLKEIAYKIKDAFAKAVKSVVRSFRTDAISLHIDTKVSQDGYVHGSISVDEAALRRESMYKANKGEIVGRTGSGIDDILSLFAHGYTLKGRAPIGYWVHSEDDEGMNVIKDTYGLEKTRALPHRDPNSFLKDFVDEVNKTYSGQCKVELNKEYL